MIKQNIILSTDQPEDLIIVLNKLLFDPEYLKQYLEPVNQFIHGYYPRINSSELVVNRLKFFFN